ncbi:glycosyltransferase [Lihuaxuella thermophila]|uniref:Glycosyltransferase involved in cell wall bisynthesis n=1 Tax=Lihuaxuella thermophila TaxID=1173111 RepID=A0A1H8G2U2_9BACL|nr:glycosyltransferase [Lihuaxuella thermophila]SEN38333.1 Glycosyltransferase involved in cell wall bisynthesis [Lihuaxuella thermophila]
MKILLFAPGNSVHTHKWAMFYQSKGYQVIVVTFSNHFSPENAKEVETLQLPKFLPRKLSYPTSVFALKRILADIQPDIFHAHYVSSYGIVAALTNYHPLYISVWGSDIYHFPTTNIINRKIVEYALNHADVICSTSYDMAQETRKYTDKPVEITPFGVDLSKFKPLGLTKTDEMITIGTAKGLTEVYGISNLIKAFAKLEKEFPHSRLLIVGDGPKRAEYEALVEELGIAHKATFTGFVANSEIPYYINQMDIFALPSYRESFGVAAVEAQACGVPVVVTNVGGLPEVVDHEVTGLIIPDNHPDHLVQAFKRLILDESLRKKLGANGVRFVQERYDWIENANRMVALYEKTLRTIRQK